MTEFLQGRVRLDAGDARDLIRALGDATIDAIVTDPPYGIGFMGKAWDRPDSAPFDPGFWREALRVLKPGGHLVAASSTRTYHRMAVAIEDAGFEIRDMVSWLYGSGFPKAVGVLKPACEPWALARRPVVGTIEANVTAHGTGVLNTEACRIEGEVNGPGTTPKSSVGGARGSMAGAMDRVEYDGSRGRWPANVVHDGSDEVTSRFPETKTGNIKPYVGEQNGYNGNFAGVRDVHHTGDAGSASRYFYSAKADVEDRFGSAHPTVKPVDLMQWLCRLVTPPGGLILDPFAGSGTTGEAAWREGMRAILFELDPPSIVDIERRLGHADGGPVARRHAITKARGKVAKAGPLFDGLD